MSILNRKMINANETDTDKIFDNLLQLKDIMKKKFPSYIDHSSTYNSYSIYFDNTDRNKNMYEQVNSDKLPSVILMFKDFITTIKYNKLSFHESNYKTDDKYRSTIEKKFLKIKMDIQSKNSPYIIQNVPLYNTKQKDKIKKILKNIFQIDNVMNSIVNQCIFCRPTNNASGIWLRLTYSMAMVLSELDINQPETKIDISEIRSHLKPIKELIQEQISKDYISNRTVSIPLAKNKLSLKIGGYTNDDGVDVTMYFLSNIFFSYLEDAIRACEILRLTENEILESISKVKIKHILK